MVIIKGGHIGEDATDYAFTRDGSVRTWTSPKYDTVHTHGTGCTFSAVITAELAKGRDVMDAIGIAKDYIALAIKYNPALGNGCGPVNHMAYGLLANGTETMDELLKKMRGDDAMNPYIHNQIRPEFNILYTLRKKNPLVICITNDVVRTFYS